METMDDLRDMAEREHHRIAEMQRSVERMELLGRSRNNGVTVKLRGTGRLTEVVIDPRLLDRYDAMAIGAFVVEAVNDGLRRLGETSQAMFAPYVAEARAFVDGYSRQIGD